mgnify:CR=1 FL=1
MRPASEIHSALDSLRAEIEEQGSEAHSGLIVARDVLAWVVGGDAMRLDGPSDFLCAFLLPDPPKLDDTPPEVN